MRLTLLFALLLPVVANAGVIAEGKSSPTPNVAIETGWRMFTLHTGAEVCANAGKPVRLDVEPKAITLYPGEVWQPNKLVVRAFDANNRFIASVPLIISISGASDIIDARGSESIVHALRPGLQAITISTYCEDGLDHIVEMRVLDTGAN